MKMALLRLSGSMKVRLGLDRSGEIQTKEEIVEFHTTTKSPKKALVVVETRTMHSYLDTSPRV